MKKFVAAVIFLTSISVCYALGFNHKGKVRITNLSDNRVEVVDIVGVYFEEGVFVITRIDGTKSLYSLSGYSIQIDMLAQ